MSPLELKSRWGRKIYWALLAAVLIVFTLVFVFPLYWMITGAMKTGEEIARMPPSLFPKTPDFSVFADAWQLFDMGLLLRNTLYYALGAWLFALAVDVTAAYALSKLRPMFGSVILGAMLATLMIPPIVVMIPAYITVTDVPLLGWQLLNSPWAIWFPVAANGFNIFLLKRFFDSIPNEILEAAEIDGVPPWRVLVSIILPISRPILGVVSIFTVVLVFKDFVWPLLVLPDSSKMTISVGLSQTAGAVTQNQIMAGLVIASVPMIIVFLFFQRSIMAGLTVGSLKG
ncbi:multiple sugar transport system permease protein [Streptomyces candidus]|uniref:Multiple sugar transport system permease protein n=1 Tax=Streptomyces candidus TaxID=67283 RepID=A0A7X0LNX1_9ACTN|nr:carbohydrate ABC transporter permease [Streptomyces candidus]MBB6435943.1 multiple sugar transport system permease protein [Streptomyces candidus]GHH43068.1 ABC transporter permease [Streptomyces candidus]